MELTQHPLSAAFPAMSEDEYNALLDSITDIGVQNPITIFEGMVLDGWNRYQATQELGYDCPSVVLGDVDPRHFVLAQNSARRSLTASQRALAAATCFQWKSAGNPQFGSAAELPKQSAVAAMAKVSERTLRDAKHIVDHGVDEVREAVRSGAASVEAAAAISKLPKGDQAEALIGAKPARFQGKPKKVPASKWLKAEIKAADATKQAESATGQVAALEEEVHALREQLTEAQGEVEAVAKVLDAGDQLAAALKDAKEQRELARGLQQRINSMMTEIATLKRSVAHWQKKAGQPA